jgi:hypothetical protein
VSIYTDLAATAKHIPDRLDPDVVRSVCLAAENMYDTLLVLRNAEKITIEKRANTDGYIESVVTFQISFLGEEEYTKDDLLKLILDLGD